MPTPQVRVRAQGRPERSVAIPGERLRIGRLPENDLVLDDLSASRCHATLEMEGDGVRIRDLGSENGTWVNGVRIAAPTPVGPGDEIRIGRHRLEVTGLDGPLASGRVSALFDFGRDAELGPSADADPAAGLVAPAGPGEPEGRIGAYAGLVVQRSGRLEGVLSWDRPSLRVGRGKDCDVVLDDDGIAGEHALLTCDGECFEVRDLGSSLGVLLNGELVPRAPLSVGDVIGIGPFELTFLLDRRPISEEVRTGEDARREAPAAGDPTDPLGHVTASLRSEGTLALEVRLPAAALPGPLREVLGEVLEKDDGEPLRIPVELRLLPRTE